MSNKPIPTHKPEEYAMIDAWCRYMGSHRPYTLQEQRKASKDNAPLDAIYPRDGYDQWVTLSEVPEAHNFRRWLANVPSPFTGLFK